MRNLTDAYVVTSSPVLSVSGVYATRDARDYAITRPCPQPDIKTIGKNIARDITARIDDGEEPRGAFNTSTTDVVPFLSLLPREQSRGRRGLGVQINFLLLCADFEIYL